MVNTNSGQNDEDAKTLAQLKQIAADLKVLEKKQLTILTEAEKLLEEDRLATVRKKLTDLTK